MSTQQVMAELFVKQQELAVEVGGGEATSKIQELINSANRGRIAPESALSRAARIELGVRGNR